eukprot:TRINITY_DN3023_c0_g1_i12.p3 TRINITY_DN3023_c0_g1~~TRINITY_DN3023_c0_g1_i12.p3  ORF type:complete len:235 (+),score=24.41 TRINITY_DN3023_c0_g1_i12:74-778(+)
MSNYVGFFVTTSGLLLSVKGVDHIAFVTGINPKLSRKAMHIVAGLMFCVTWMLYSEGMVARIACGILPMLASLYFALVGAGFIPDKKLINGVSRQGSRQELLGGPLIYGLVSGVLCILFWRDRPEGIIAIAIVCGGDGIADIIGRKWGYLLGPILWNPNKTYMGSLGCFVGGFLSSSVLVWLFYMGGFINMELDNLVWQCFISSAVGSLVESLPQTEDNLTVPLAVVISQRILF